MKSAIVSAVAILLVSYSHVTSATTSSYCPKSQNACFRWGVPEAAATSGSGDVYFQIQAPTTYQWVALGIGSRMAGAEMFLVYQDGKGNVTLSTRTTSGHTMPHYTKRSGVTLIDGSGVANNTMIANIRCGDCSGLDLSGSNSWIAAWKQGSALDSTSPSESIQQHDDYNIFDVNFAQATFSSTGNPFTNSASSNESGNAVDSGSSGDDDDRLANAHGVIMAIVFVIAYPVGALLMPLLGKWLVHATWQSLAFLAMWAGFGIGFVISQHDGSWGHESHTILGAIVCVLLSFQPILGWAHHKHYLKHQRRGLVSYAHIWYGRVLMALGIINGGLGLQLASAPVKYIVVYSVASGIIAILYLAGAVLALRRKFQRGKGLSSTRSACEDEFLEPEEHSDLMQSQDEWFRMREVDARDVDSRD
ncbi:hypothetical protein EDB80DRAFT_782544 [Ilyonectria destructans]|nr:hypothetical protein EDB80DRAFT_782544 [Ilyonectria destructans]